MLFLTTVRPDLPVHSTRLAHTMRFEDGRYETDDRAEIHALRRHPLVTEAFTPGGIVPEPALVRRDELYERAQELHIPGRSAMDKDELAAAVTDAQDEDGPDAGQPAAD